MHELLKERNQTKEMTTTSKNENMVHPITHNLKFLLSSTRTLRNDPSHLLPGNGGGSELVGVAGGVGFVDTEPSQEEEPE